jgi:hypothetical protein
MGMFKKIFKGAGNFFKKIGKFIKKGFGKLGRFMNKFGILGQIGMMFITGGIASMALQGFSTLGASFMAGLAKGGEFAQLSHGILQGAAKIASVPMKAISSITDQVFGAVTDIASAMVGQGVTAAPGITFTADASTFDKIFENVAGRFKTGVKSVGSALGDLKKFSGDVVTGDYDPRYEDINIGTKENPIMVEREITYSEENRRLFETANLNNYLAEVARQKKLMEDATSGFSTSQVAPPSQKTSLLGGKPVREFFHLEDAVKQVALREVGSLLQPSPQKVYGKSPIARSQTPLLIQESSDIAGVGQQIPSFGGQVGLGFGSGQVPEVLAFNDWDNWFEKNLSFNASLVAKNQRPYYA